MQDFDWVKLKNKLEFYKQLHVQTASLRYAISDQENIDGERKWEPFSPSDFVYSFFLFNTLYNFDWKRCGNVVKKLPMYPEDSRAYSQLKKIELFVKFVLGDKEFCQMLAPGFRRMITFSSKKDDIIHALNGIAPFEGKQGLIDGFKSICNENGCLSEEAVQKVCKAIYMVRCNMFHGEKNMKDLNRGDQQLRLSIYADFLTAVVHSLFVYVEYKAKPQFDIDNEVNSFIRNMQENRLDDIPE